MRNLPLTFDWHYIGQKYGEDFAKFCGLLRIYELYVKSIETHARAFLPLNISAISSVARQLPQFEYIFGTLNKLQKQKTLFRCGTGTISVLRSSAPPMPDGELKNTHRVYRNFRTKYWKFRPLWQGRVTGREYERPPFKA